MAEARSRSVVAIAVIVATVAAIRNVLAHGDGGGGTHTYRRCPGTRTAEKSEVVTSNAGQ